MLFSFPPSFLAWVFVLCGRLQRLHTAGTRMCCGCMCVGYKNHDKKVEGNSAKQHRPCILAVLLAVPRGVGLGLFGKEDFIF
jgi:hypothetical protein